MFQLRQVCWPTCLNLLRSGQSNKVSFGLESLISNHSCSCKKKKKKASPQLTPLIITELFHLSFTQPVHQSVAPEMHTFTPESSFDLTSNESFEPCIHKKYTQTLKRSFRPSSWEASVLTAAQLLFTVTDVCPKLLFAQVGCHWSAWRREISSRLKSVWWILSNI